MKNLLSFFPTLTLIVFASCINSNSNSLVSFYLDNEIGNDSNPGTLKRPLKTISSLNSRLTDTPGNIFFAGGQVFEGTLVVSGIDGSDSVAVTIRSYGNGRAEIIGGNNEAIRIKTVKTFALPILISVETAVRTGILPTAFSWHTAVILLLTV